MLCGAAVVNSIYLNSAFRTLRMRVLSVLYDFQFPPSLSCLSNSFFPVLRNWNLLIKTKNLQPYNFTVLKLLQSNKILNIWVHFSNTYHSFFVREDSHFDNSFLCFFYPLNFIFLLTLYCFFPSKPSALRPRPVAFMLLNHPSCSISILKWILFHLGFLITPYLHLT